MKDMFYVCMCVGFFRFECNISRIYILLISSRKFLFIWHKISCKFLVLLFFLIYLPHTVTYMRTRLYNYKFMYIFVRERKKISVFLLCNKIKKFSNVFFYYLSNLLGNYATLDVCLNMYLKIDQDFNDHSLFAYFRQLDISLTKQSEFLFF